MGPVTGRGKPRPYRTPHISVSFRVSPRFPWLPHPVRLSHGSARLTATTIKPPRPATLTGLWRGLLDLVFPPRCVGCGCAGVWFCPDCLARVQPLPPPICRICGDRVFGADLCPSCRQDPPPIDGIRSVSLHTGPLRKAVHGFKYRRQRDLAPVLASLLADYLILNPLPGDLLVPVPLHPDRQRQRGYNQSVLLARALAEALPHAGLTVNETAMRRVRATASQTKLDRGQRKQNVTGAFACMDGAVAGRQVLLIDDVCTTGATLEACALACRQAGAVSVWGLTVTRG
jgi:ComF family protein